MVLSSMRTGSCPSPPGSGDNHTCLMESSRKETGSDVGIGKGPTKTYFRSPSTFRSAKWLVSGLMQIKTSIETFKKIGGGGVREGVAPMPQCIY